MSVHKLFERVYDVRSCVITVQPIYPFFAIGLLTVLPYTISLETDKTPSYLSSHPDPRYFTFGLHLIKTKSIYFLKEANNNFRMCITCWSQGKGLTHLAFLGQWLNFKQTASFKIAFIKIRDHCKLFYKYINLPKNVYLTLR